MDHTAEMRRLIERVADGEAVSAEVRWLCQELDQAPPVAGAAVTWRTLAVALLEAQTLRSSLRTIARGEVAGAAVAPARERAPMPGASVGGRAGMHPWALAAGLLLSAGIGWLWGAAGDGLQRDPVTVQAPPTARPAAVAKPQLAPELVKKLQQPGWHTVPVTYSDGQGAERSLALPTYVSAKPEKPWSEHARETLPSKLVEELNASGHEIATRRYLYTVPIDEERQLVLPVDQYEVRYTGKRTI